MKYHDISLNVLESNLEWINGNLFDAESLRIATYGIEYLYHCAAEVNLTNSSEDELMKTNVEGTQMIINAAIESHIKKACFVSSIASLGKSESNDLINENSQSIIISSAYGRSKKAVESLIFDAEKLGLKSVIVNPGVVLGVTNKNDSSSKIIFLAKNGMPFSTSGASGFVDVRDLCCAMIKLMQSHFHGERYIIVGTNTSQHNLISLLHAEFGKNNPLC